MRVIRSGDVFERQKAAQVLSVSGPGIGAQAAMTALIAALGDEDAGVRARAAESLGLFVASLTRKRWTTRIRLRFSSPRSARLM